MRRHPDPTVAHLDAPVDRLVMVVPHPDDEALATGLLLAHAAELRLPTVIIAVTDGDAAYPTVDGGPWRGPSTASGPPRSPARAHPAAVRRPGVRDGGVSREIDRVAAGIAVRVTPTTLLVAPSIHDRHPDHQACGGPPNRWPAPHRHH